MGASSDCICSSVTGSTGFPGLMTGLGVGKTDPFRHFGLIPTLSAPFCRESKASTSLATESRQATPRGVGIRCANADAGHISDIPDIPDAADPIPPLVP